MDHYYEKYIHTSPRYHVKLVPENTRGNGMRDNGSKE